MPIIEYSGADRTGKTTMAIGDLFRIWESGLHQPCDTWGNQYVACSGYNYLNNDKLKAKFSEIISNHIFFQCIFIDDASAFFPARGYSDKHQSNILKHIWQLEKQCTTLLYTDHIGKTVDLILDEATHITILPCYLEETGIIEYEVLFRRDIAIDQGNVENVRELWERFSTWMPSV